MLLLLLLCHAAAEWVQISQLHYRKPPDQPHAPYQPLTRPQSTTEPGWTNQTLPRWKPATVERVTHLGTIKRVHVEHIFKKDHNAPSEEDDKLSLSLDKLDFDTKDDSDKRNVATISVNPTRSPPRVAHEAVSSKRNPFLTAIARRTTTTELPFTTVEQTEHIIPFKNTNTMYIGSGGSTEKLTVNKHNMNTNEKFVTNDVHNDNEKIYKKYDFHNVEVPFVTKQNDLDSDDKDLFLTSKLTETKRINKHRDEDKTVTPVNRNKVNEAVHNTHENRTKVPPAIEFDEVEASANKTNVNTIENVLKILKVVAETISRNTKSSFQSKIKYLHNLKNTILANIEVRMESLWGGARRARSAARGHVAVPSAESALMTISFLTFAVFLIKLVLQVIQKYKNSTMVMSPALVATVRRLHAAPAHLTTDTSLT